MRKYVFGFVAGFLATLLFHQPALAALTELGLAKASVYSMLATKPLGVPVVLSISFFGGVWGMVFAALEGKFPKGAGYWLSALVFGSLALTLVAWFVVAPLKGLPMAGGWQLPRMLTGLVVNGVWGLGTALIYRVLRRGAARPVLAA